MTASLSTLQRQRANALVEEMQDDLEEYAFRLVEAEDDNERLRSDLATRPLIQQAIEITEREAADPVTHWRMNWITARALGLDVTSADRFEREARANAERRLDVLRGLLTYGAPQ